VDGQKPREEADDQTRYTTDGDNGGLVFEVYPGCLNAPETVLASEDSRSGGLVVPVVVVRGAKRKGGMEWRQATATVTAARRRLKQGAYAQEID
jgi:hypothetical protein